MKRLYDNQMTLIIKSKSNNEAFARITIAAFVAQLDPTIDEMSDIKTAVSEAVTNSIIHGYEDDNGEVEINARIIKRMVEIEIIDKGKGIDNIAEAMRPLYTSKPNFERSGMGFTIMQSFMDNVKVESDVGRGTRVLMSKRILSAEQEKAG